MSHRRSLVILGYGLIIIALCLPISVLIWRAWQAQQDNAWDRYTDRALGISWSAPANWDMRALRNPSGRTLVFSTPGDPRAVLYVSTLRDVAAYRRWDPAAVNMSIAGLPAISEWLPNGQNPPQRQVSFRLGSDKLVLLHLMYDPAFDITILDRILSSLKTEVEDQYIRVYIEVDSLTSGWSPCRPACGLSDASPNWCDLLVTSAEWNGVDVFSNGSNLPYFYYNECPDFYGLKFQCVELIQRYYWERVGRNTRTGGPSWGIASAYQAWRTHPPEYTAYPNGGGSIPQPGDILVWRPEGRYAPHGHVGVVVLVEGDRVVFVQQNSKEGGISSRLWANGWMDDEYLYGWLHATISDHMPPDGAITSPSQTVTTTSDVLRLEGWGADAASGFDRAQFYASYSGTVQAIGQPFTSTPFMLDWNLADDGVPTGLLTITLTIWDKEGNVAYSPQGVRQVLVLRASDCQDIIANGSFELNRNWLLGGDVPASYSGASAVIGQRSLLLGIVEGPNLVSTSLAEQTITIPADAVRLRLRWSYWVQSGPYSIYPQRAILIDAKGTPHELFALNGPPSNARAWRQVELDETLLGAFRGQQVQLQFQVFNDGWQPEPAALFIDDLLFEACR
ncbi:MAG: CHAP domain-containing protein [Anaerolineae bacterium]